MTDQKKKSKKLNQLATVLSQTELSLRKHGSAIELAESNNVDKYHASMTPFVDNKSVKVKKISPQGTEDDFERVMASPSHSGTIKLQKRTSSIGNDMMSDCGTYTTHATPQRRGRNSIISEEQHESDEKKPLKDHHDQRGDKWGKIYERQVFPRLSE